MSIPETQQRERWSARGAPNERDIAIVGAAGFVGRHLLTQLHQRSDLRVRVLVHRTVPVGVGGNITAVRGDLLDADSLRALVSPGAAVINLAYLGGAASRNVEAVTNLAEACAAAGAARLVHCSTAVVVGRSAAARVVEETPCRPYTSYQRSKLELERLAFGLGDGRFEVTVLRPSAIVGPGGRNLLKFVHSLRHGRRLLNYARSSLFGNRTLNLVHVGNVAAALIFLALTESAVDREVFLISDDESAASRFRPAERHLMAALGVPDYRVPPVPIPQTLLTAVLRAARRADTDPRRIYDDGKIAGLGFRKPCSLSDGIRAFALDELTAAAITPDAHSGPATAGLGA